MITIKQCVDENFNHYKKPCMLIGFPSCTWKCGKELCQNSPIALLQNITIDEKEIVQRYLDNPLTSSIVLAGLEPFDTWGDVFCLIDEFRRKTKDDIIIYTGYYKEEIAPFIKELQSFNNIIVKYGRYIPNEKSHFDQLLGVTLASSNQYSERIS